MSTEGTVLAIFVTAKCFPIANPMEPVMSIFGWRPHLRVSWHYKVTVTTVRYHLFSSGLSTGQIGVLKRKTVGTMTSSLGKSWTI